MSHHKKPARKDVIQALCWIRDNLYRQNAAETAVYWLTVSEYPCESAQQAVACVVAVCGQNVQSRAFEADLDQYGVRDLFAAFGEAARNAGS